MGDRAAIALPRMPVLPRLLFAILAACGTSIAASTCSSKEGHGSCTASPPTSQPYILVVGSINVDITMQVTRLPHHGETITARSPSTATAVGGKGANTAVAAAKLLNNTATGQHRHASAFICQFGNDAHAAWLQSVLLEHGVDVSGSGHSTELPSGQGIVMLEEDGSVSSVVVGGSNTAWADAELSTVKQRAASAGIVLLQREVPEQVNEAAAQAAHAAGVPVLQDMGGEDRLITDQLLRLITYLVPNESELRRLTGLPTGSDEQVAEAARHLQARGASNVLVTLGERGSLLLAQDGQVLRQRACPVPGGVVLDATGAGDAFRAAFAVSLVEGRSLRHSLQFASVAGAIAASRLGAVPSLPARHELDQLLTQWLAQPGSQAGDTTHSTPTPSAPCDALAQSASPPAAATTAAREPAAVTDTHPGFPLKFASRLNSMKERPDLWPDNQIRNDTLKLLARQATTRGLDLVDFNFPQHMRGLEYQHVRDALAAAGLGAGAVCIRFEDDMRLGAFSNPDALLRAKAVQLVVQGCRWARELGAQELVVWSAFDGYDYTLSIAYVSAWQRVVDSYQQVCDACPDLKVSIEFKPTDESSRFSIVPSTGAALLLAHQIDRPNFGLTLDLGHMLMAGENPAQSIAMAAAAGRLFGLQMGDGHSRLGAEDGLMFGAANPRTALEVVLTLQRVGYHGHVYFDTFPRNEDPVKEAEYNVRRFKALWAKAQLLIDKGIVPLLYQHDAMGVAELLEQLDIL